MRLRSRFGAPAGGLLRKAQVEEFHVITWESKKEQIFEMPTGGAAIMRQGPNLLKLSRKEQCLALLTQLRTKFKIDGYIYRVFPNGEVQYLHPKVGSGCYSGGRGGGPLPAVLTAWYSGAAQTALDACSACRRSSAAA